MRHIMRCPRCGTYSLKGVCPDCATKTNSPIPPKFSPEDKYARFRRTEKRDSFIKNGWL